MIKNAEGAAKKLSFQVKTFYGLSIAEEICFWSTVNEDDYCEKIYPNYKIHKHYAVKAI